MTTRSYYVFFHPRCRFQTSVPLKWQVYPRPPIFQIELFFWKSPFDITSKVFQILEYSHTKAPDLEFYTGHFVDNLSIGGVPSQKYIRSQSNDSGLKTLLLRFINESVLKTTINCHKKELFLN